MVLFTAPLAVCRAGVVSNFVQRSVRGPRFECFAVLTRYRFLQTTARRSCVAISRMRFVQFEWNGRRAVGVETKEGGDIIDVTEVDPTVPRNMRDFIAGGQPNLLAAKK